MARRPKNVVAVTPGGDITLDHILGFYALSQVPNAPVSASKLRRLWMAEGLEEKLVPKKRAAVDNFMAACRSVETRRTADSDRTYEIKVDRVLEAPEECVYQITKMVRDRDARLIEHPKAIRMVYHDGKITAEPLDKKLAKELEQLSIAIQQEFDEFSTKVPGAKVRSAIRATLAEYNATPIQNKGVFFVPKAGKSALESIQNVLTGLYGKEGIAELHLIPCANDEGERKMIARHFQAHVLDEIDQLQAEISQRLKDDSGVRSDRQASMVATRKKLEEAVARYRDMLDTKLLVVDEKLDILDKGLEELLMTAA